MIRKICLFLVFMHVSAEQRESQDWDLAVAVTNQIDLLVANGTVLDTIPSFIHLKALTFDSKRHRFITSDMNGENDTIYTTQPKNEGDDMVTILEGIPADVLGLAKDPETDILYWTDPIHKAIHSIKLNDTLKKSNIFIQFDLEKPQDIAIHSCKRYIYFTNSFPDHPSINRVSLETRNHEVLIDSNLHTTVGITIDYVAERLYWSDWGPGIYFRIESSNLEGEERALIFGSTYQQPLGLAVDSKFIYWTDPNNNALWRYQKNSACQESPLVHQLMRFEERPGGLVTKYLGVAGTPTCEEITELSNKYSKSTVKCNDEGNVYCKKVENRQTCPGSEEVTEPSCMASKCLDYCVQEDCDFRNRYS